jgi:hypothetical protein
MGSDPVIDLPNGRHCWGMVRHAPFFAFAAVLSLGFHCGSVTTAPCPPCSLDSDCNGGICAKLAQGTFCATACPNGNECSGSEQCTAVTSTKGDQASACVDPTSTCDQAVPDSGGPKSDGGFTSSITGTGGTESSLYFAVVGDTRPATEDDTQNYPTSIITKIFSDITAMPQPPPFVVSTGDYQFSNPYNSEATKQLALYVNARGSYAGVQFAAMGNHECTGGTASNCGTGNVNGLTNNYNAFMSALLGPIQQTSPYYVINVNAPDKSWTAKFAFIAANAWTSAQSTWLDTTLAVPTTYTFVVRHESASADTAPGVIPSEAIMAKHPYTMAIVGHSHYYERTSQREVIIGNGGAPISGSGNYGYAIFAQRADGAIVVDMYDYQTNVADAKFHFAVKADGSSASP